MSEINNCYETLGLSPGASADTIKHAYRDLVRIWHPDRFTADSRLQAKAQEKMKLINQAYEKLTELHRHGPPPEDQAPRSQPAPGAYHQAYTSSSYQHSPPPESKPPPAHKRDPIRPKTRPRSRASAVASIPPEYEWFFRVSKVLAVILSLNLIRLVLVSCTGS